VALGLGFLRGIGYRGFASLEFKRDDRDGVLKLIEVNPEPQTGLPRDCGVDFPMIEYLDLGGRGPRPQHAFAVGVRWWNAPEDLKSLLAQHGVGARALCTWAGSGITARSFATFSLEDPMPFALSWAARLLRSVRRRLRLYRPRCETRAPTPCTGAGGYRARAVRFDSP